jgi:signal transduction histidine kinase
MRLTRSPWGLRATLTALFALGGVLLAGVMALGTYGVARNYLLDQREHGALRQAFADASYVRDGLLTSGRRVSDVLGAVSPPSRSTVLVQRRDRWYSSSLDVGEGELPAALRGRVGEGSATVQWASVAGMPSLLVGVPLPAADAEFYEVTSADELQRTLRTLRAVLFGFAVAVMVAAAVLGRWAARRAVAPLDAVAGAAARIAGGRLDTRLPATDDPDLATFVGSFNTMVDALAERIERDARFTADVSHELRSPLTALLTSVDVLDRRRGELSPRTVQVLDLVRGDLDRFHRMLEDLLDLGRLDAGAPLRVVAGVDAAELVRQTLLDSGRSADLRQAPATPLLIDVDKQQLSRALRNLFDNADRHGGGLTCVSLTQEGLAGHPPKVTICVDDQGPGVPSEDRERVFDRFHRDGSRGSLPGAGLGLSLVSETVRAHAGVVWCMAADGRGARFVVQLPASSADPASPT